MKKEGKEIKEKLTTKRVSGKVQKENDRRERKEQVMRRERN